MMIYGYPPDVVLKNLKNGPLAKTTVRNCSRKKHVCRLPQRLFVSICGCGSWTCAELFLLKERSDGGGTISRLFGSMYVCMSVRNKRRRQYHRNAFLFKKNGKKISNQIATFDLSRISRTSEGGRPNAPKIATTTDYCP